MQIIKFVDTDKLSGNVMTVLNETCWMIRAVPSFFFFKHVCFKKSKSYYEVRLLSMFLKFLGKGQSNGRLLSVVWQKYEGQRMPGL